jgi:murein DD-endopeptidase MepM/ murein hydrolase activator NlpD
MLAIAALVALAVAAATEGGGAPPRAAADGGTASADGATAHDAATAESAALLPLPPFRDSPSAAGPVVTSVAAPASPAAKRGKTGKGGKAPRGAFMDVILEAQNHLQGVARRYAQLIMSRRFDEARLLHEEEGGRRPDWPTLRAAAAAFLDLHGAPRAIEQSLITYSGAEITTFYFTAQFQDGSELPMRVAVDHWGHISGAGVGSDVVPAARKRYDRHDQYKTRTVLSLPFHGVWTASNATLAPGNGHYLNANQRFAVDFVINEEVAPGKWKSHRNGGRQNTDYFSYGLDVLAPADGVVVQVVDGVPDNPPGQTDVYYRLGNSVVLSFENGEYAYLSHLMMGSLRVRAGDRVRRGQTLAKCGNSGNSTGPHLHFQLTDGPNISHAGSLPAYFRKVRKNGATQLEVLPQSGDRLENPPNS